jgi:hypothetical protein
MPLQILNLGKMFRPGTSHIYPPFKKGRYMEEYVYEYLTENKDDIKTNYVYLPVFWTHLQNHPGFTSNKQKYNILLQQAFLNMPSDTKYFTVVQHDDGPQLDLPHHTIVFGACSGTVPLPLIYEDTTERLLQTPRLPKKDLLASFVGTSTTHPLRNEMFLLLSRKHGIKFHIKELWAVSVPEEDAKAFITATLHSKFCLAPRGYGRSSFRFFEAMLLDTIPVYFWNDVEWLPYKEKIDYSRFSVSIQQNDIPKTYEILRSISQEKYVSMIEELKRVRHYFTLEGMTEYIIEYISEE